MKKLTLTLVAVACGLILSIPAFAFGPGGGRGPGYCGQAGWNRLNLTDEQKTKIEALVTASQKEIRPISEKMFDESVALRKFWREDNPDRNKILARQKELRTLRDQIEDKHTALRFEIRKVLTPGQNEKLAGFGWGRGQGFGPRGGMRGPGGFGPGYCN